MLLTITKVNGQDFKSDSMKAALAKSPSDSAKVATLLRLALYYQRILQKNDTAFLIYQNALAISREKGFLKQEIVCLSQLALVHSKYLTADSAHLLLQEALNKSKLHHFPDQEIFILTACISTERDFFIKDSFFTYYDKMLSIIRENKIDSLGFMATFAHSATDKGNYPKAIQELF